MTMANEITEDQLLAEYARVGLAADDPGLTVEEWSEKLGRGVTTVRRVLRFAKKRGSLIVGRKAAETLSGRLRMVDCYRIEQRAAGKKPKGKK